MRHVLSVAVAAILASTTSQGMAQERYRELPPVVVSPDLSAPWVMQLQRSPVGHQRRQPARHGLPGVEVRVAPQPIARERARVAIAPAPDQMQTGALPSATRDAGAQIDPKFLPQTVAYDGAARPGTIVIDTRRTSSTSSRRRSGAALRRRHRQARLRMGRHAQGDAQGGVAGLASAGGDDRPREEEGPHTCPSHMAGGPENPLGARALYLGSTLYRIHGTNQPWTIGGAVSSGCIRMRNEDVIDLYERVKVGTKVVVI
jgi:lipoprotein-anchoring transpeptidase ErfK/SrfK